MPVTHIFLVFNIPVRPEEGRCYSSSAPLHLRKTVEGTQSSGKGPGLGGPQTWVPLTCCVILPYLFDPQFVICTVQVTRPFPLLCEALFCHSGLILNAVSSERPYLNTQSKNNPLLVFPWHVCLILFIRSLFPS